MFVVLEPSVSEEVSMATMSALALLLSKQSITKSAPDLIHRS